jgi:hypothetical protein
VLRKRQRVKLPRHQKLVNQFGTVTATMIRPDLLLVPSAKGVDGPPPPLDATSVDAFQCYHIAHAKTRAKNLRVVDQLGTLTIDIERPRHLCVPVNVNGASPGAELHDGILTCYEVRLANAGPFVGPKQFFVENAFGATTFRRLLPASLCVPTSIAP